MNFVLEMINLFDTFSIEVVPRETNQVTDSLAVSASTLIPCDIMTHGLCKLDVNLRPTVPNNLEHWKVFNDDTHIL
jgi:hypothetical protein